MDLAKGNGGASNDLDVVLTYKIEGKFVRLEKLFVDACIGKVVIGVAIVMDDKPTIAMAIGYVFVATMFNGKGNILIFGLFKLCT